MRFKRIRKNDVNIYYDQIFSLSNSKPLKRKQFKQYVLYFKWTRFKGSYCQMKLNIELKIGKTSIITITFIFNKNNWFTSW